MKHLIGKPKPLWYAEQEVIAAAKEFVAADRGSQTHMDLRIDRARERLYAAISKLEKIK